MMVDYGYAFAVTLAQKLKQKIVGGIHVCITDNDVLVVKVIRDDIVDCTIRVHNFSERIRNGWTTDYAMHEIVSDYKRCIMKRYFY